ncbi:MAG: ABC transporter ATP-binding protein [Candidatus Nitrosocaldaceae archaeon]
MNAIDVEKVSRVFKRNDNVIKALDNVTLSIEKGEIFGLLGANGAGKTTLIKILTTLLLPSEGNAYVYGYNVIKESNDVRRIINLVSGGETPGYGILTVRENLWFFSQIYGLSNSLARERIDELIKDMELEEYENVRMHKLSTGYKQRLNIARGFINDPKVLFLDEPTLGLDVLNAKHIRRYIKEWVKNNKDKSILLTTHYMSEADEICDKIAIIFKGKIIAYDTPKRLKESVSNVTSAVVEVNSTLMLDNIYGMPAKVEYNNGITRIRILLDEQSSIARVVSYLDSHGYNILSIKLYEPTLEDVYIKYVGLNMNDQ